MASLSNTRRPELARAARPATTAQRRAVARKAGGTAAPAAAAATATPPAAAAAPAYLQAKLAMSSPGDASEQQADRVATQVARSPRNGAAAGAPAASPTGTSTSTGTVARAPAATPAPAASAPVVQRASLAPGAATQAVDAVAPVPAAREIQRTAAALPATATAPPVQPAPASSTPGQLQRDAHANADTTPAAESGPAAEPAVTAGTEARIQARRGRGEPLAQDARADMQARFGQDFSQVHIHTDAEADALCTATQARAFTLGNDVFFAAGEYAPHSEAGRELLAHELTHVVQQGGGSDVALARAVDPAPSPVPEPGGAAATALANVSVLDLPPIKHRHATLYSGAGARRAAGYARDTEQEQISVWNQGVQLTEDRIEAKLKQRNADFTRPSTPGGQVNLTVGSHPLSSSWRGLRSRLLIPDWDRHGHALTTRADRFQVDHMVELQVFGDTGGDAGNVAGNLELLKGRPNASSGSTIKTAIYSKVSAWLAASDPTFATANEDGKKDKRRQWLRSHSITFTEIRRGEGMAGEAADWWTREEIEQAAPLDATQPAAPANLQGSAGHFVLASGAGGVEIGRYSYGSALNFEPHTDVLRKAMAGVRISQIQLDSAIETGNPGDPAGSLVCTWDLPSAFRAGEAVTIPLVAVAPYCAAPGQIPALNTDFSHLSPVTLPTIELRDGDLFAQGTLQPSLPLLGNQPITVELDGADLRFEVRYSPGMLALPLPGLSIDECSVALFYSTRQGFGGEGQIGFAIDRLGSGELTVQVTQADGFSAEGAFHFDTSLFDQADARVWYRHGEFGGEGTLGINTPDKVRGIRAAHLSVGFGGGQFSATGDVQPDIPGVQQAALRVSYAEATGLTIGGALQLAANPAIRSGSVDVTVNKLGEAWRVAATGTAQPAIPGVDSELTVSYDDGAFDARFSGAFQRGMLAGTAEVGVTNRAVDESGHASGAPEPGAPLIVYGAGSATLQIAPWLQGTAGIRFAPDGEVTVSGEIGLPGSLQIFARHELHKPLFAMATQIPVFPGIVAEVGGNLSASAGIGPGVLDRLAIHIDYNPAHEEATHVTGDAHLNVPADAGVRLGARAGIGLGITGASATGGIELGGSLGVAGAAEAGVHIDWTPARGLVVDAEGYLHAEPRLRFDVSGYVSVSALGFSIYDERWELAAYELGSNLRLGLRFPIHYEDGQPFDVSLDDVQFEVPDVDPAAMVRQLGAQIF